MTLRQLSCTQFAGLRDTDVRFDSGLNVLYGKNESGKSTLVNMLSRILFQSARMDGRSDKEFRELYFPSARKGSTAKGDFIDGKVTFETPNGTYTLSKEWGADGRALLSTPDGVIRDAKTIDAVLREVLSFGEGVYTQLLLSSQRGADNALQTLLDASKKTDAKQDIADAVTMAAAECDGISLDVIEQAIEIKIDELLGKHWDLELDRPVRKTGRWATGLGEILKAYYALEDAKTILSQIAELELSADRATAMCNERDKAVVEAQVAFDTFQGFSASLAVRGERLDKIRRLEADVVRYREVLVKWPALSEKLEAARSLETELAVSQAKKRFFDAKVLDDRLQAVEKYLTATHAPTTEQLATVKAAQQRVNAMQNQLCGMNVTAALQLFGDHTVEVRSLRTGDMLTLSDLSTITEAVCITVPGVMELRLTPADIDAVCISQMMKEETAVIDAHLREFGVDTIESLEELLQRVQLQQRERDTVSSQLTICLQQDSLETLAASAQTDTAVRDEEIIRQDIVLLCGGTDITRFITVTETLLKGYEAEYKSINALKATAFDVVSELEKVKASVESADTVPECYRHITDPEAYLSQLQATLRQAQQAREEALTAKTVAMGRLEAYKEQLVQDPQDALEAATRRFTDVKELLAHWMHIRDVFAVQKEQLGGNPMVDLARRFAENLRIVSADRVTTEFPACDRLHMQMYSGERIMDFAKLSEGTKETVSLSFRLAMVDHLFPDGGGVIVLDDPFSNMDAERTSRSCELLADFAKRHQVLFLTCKEEYIDLLGGQTIRI